MSWKHEGRRQILDKAIESIGLARAFGIFLLVVPSTCLAVQDSRTMMPTASYDSVHHGLVVYSVQSPTHFVVVFRNKSVILNFIGTEFERNKAKVPDETLLNQAAKSRENNLISQTQKAFSHRGGKIIEIEKLKRFGYKVIQYSIPIYSGNAILANGGQIVVTRNNCKRAWRTTVYGITSINIFRQQSKIYLEAVMYAVGADGYTPSIKVFRLSGLCNMGS